MKKNFFSLIVIALPAFSAAGQLNVPDAVKAAFNNKFPAATNVKWEKENKKELEVNFRMNNTDVSANFGLDGSWVETETTILSSELPTAVSNAVSSKFPGAVYGRTEKIEKPGNKIMYEVNITVKGKKKELEFNPDGSIMQ